MTSLDQYSLTVVCEEQHNVSVVAQLSGFYRPSNPSMMFLSRNYVQMKTKLSEKTLISPIFENTNVTALFKTMMATNDDTKLL